MQAQGTCVGGMAGVQNWMLIRAPSTGTWQANLAFPGMLIPLESRASGFTDVFVGGPGLCFGIWRWNGSAYDHLCNAAEDGATCENACPASVPIRIGGEELPPFTTGGASPE